jgi:hypothetical protein
MKTAIYIEDGVVQLVITPETKFEKNSMMEFHDKILQVKFFSGSFYDCRGGWVRQTNYYPQVFSNDKDDQSLILRIAESPANTDERQA